MRMRAIVGVAVGVVGVLYPVGVYLALGRVAPGWVMLPISLLWLARAATVASAQPGGRALPMLAFGCCVVLAALGSQAWLRAYPVLVSGMLLGLFVHSLRYGPPVIESIARLRHADLSPRAVAYTRRVTQVWCGFFLVNGLIAAALGLWASWSWWTLYNGVISYVLIGLLLVGEKLLRRAAQQAA
jgi:uncharacterized membrane protein